MPVDAALLDGPGGSLTVVLAGELDLADAQHLRTLLARAVERSAYLTVDLAGVTFLDCTILGVLLGARRTARDAGGGLRLDRCRPAVRRLLALTELEGQFGLARS